LEAPLREVDRKDMHLCHLPSLRKRHHGAMQASYRRRRKGASTPSVQSVTDFADLKAHHLTQIGSSVVIDGTHGDSITLEHVKLNTLDASDFLF
jgi:hypothetical protein